ncbi:Ltp family lipoprotein [Phycicoccus sp. CSK15P-2]|uniref:Ltp family lipoprotein n=1 Tax=Phycicoccus sp. CSK15P-2 TaxID=2807627 RepID=UPI00194FE752|nr:Ltp family lipoprotein [Phycicoccus sp. CSK15P-2]MBM6404158.1 Ltp family lipoprotein [Phycicoccus sp. CSK15P-2]
MSTTPAGWYPQADGSQRYWDGEQWTVHTAPGGSVESADAAATTSGAGGAADTAGAAGTAKAGSTGRPWFAKKRFAIPAAVAVLVVGGSALSANGTESDAVDATTSASSSASTEDDAPADTDAAPEAEAEAEPAAEEPEPKPVEPKGTTAQRNALRSAEGYLDFKAFSKKGLIEQLSSEYGDGYDKADATWAVEQLEVDWNEQAVRAGQEYLDLQGFSRSGLIEQLSSEYGTGSPRSRPPTRSTSWVSDTGSAHAVRPWTTGRLLVGARSSPVRQGTISSAPRRGALGYSAGMAPTRLTSEVTVDGAEVQATSSKSDAMGGPPRSG